MPLQWRPGLPPFRSSSLIRSSVLHHLRIRMIYLMGFYSYYMVSFRTHRVRCHYKPHVYSNHNWYSYCQYFTIHHLNKSLNFILSFLCLPSEPYLGINYCNNLLTILINYKSYYSNHSYYQSSKIKIWKLKYKYILQYSLFEN